MPGLADIHQAASQPHLAALATRLGCWPLLLTLANGLLTDLVDAHQSIAEALATVGEAYQTRGVTAFRLDNVEERQRTVDACLSVSLQHLETFTPAHYHALERYQELAVFPEDTDIPLATLQIYWKGSASLESWEAKDLCIRLHRISLLLSCDLDADTIRLHDVLRSYLIQHTGSHLPALHQRLLDAHRQHYHLTRWADLPQSEAYLWQYLLWHYCQAGRWDEIAATLTDLRFLVTKAHIRGVVELEDNLAQVVAASTIFSRTQPPTVDALHPELVVLPAIQHRVKLISHLLRQSTGLEEMGRVALLYLGWQEPFLGKQRLLEEALPRPYVVAWHPLPEQSHFATRSHRSAHFHPIRCCGLSGDGSLIASFAFGSNGLTLWDADSGNMLRTRDCQVFCVFWSEPHQ